jgi:hypothetical protein
MSSSNRPLSPQDVGELVASVTTMSLPQKQLVMDEMFHAQPNVLGTAIVATRAASTGETQDAVLEIAMIVFRALQADLQSHGTISEAAIDGLAQRNVNMWRFLDGETGQAFTRSTRLTLESYPEPGLLAYVVHRLAELRVQEPQVILAMKTMLDVCVAAKWPGVVVSR